MKRALLLLLAAAACTDDRPLPGLEIRPPRQAALFEGENPDGTRFSLEAARGKVVVIAFGYTSCADICPMTLAKLQTLLRRVEDDEPLEAVFVTVDPERDTPERVGAYLGAFSPRLRGPRLVGAALEDVKRGYQVLAVKTDPATGRPGAPAGYLLDHSSGFFVVDRAGRFRLRLPLDVPDGELHRAVRRLLDEEVSP